MDCENEIHLNLVDLKAELLESVNRRIEELTQWVEQYPQFADNARVLQSEGIDVGKYIKSMAAEYHDDLPHVVELHKAFLLNYE